MLLIRGAFVGVVILLWLGDRRLERKGGGCLIKSGILREIRHWLEERPLVLLHVALYHQVRKRLVKRSRTELKVLRGERG